MHTYIQARTHARTHAHTHTPHTHTNTHTQMAKWLKQTSQWHEMCCHDLEVMSSNSGRVELRVLGTSVLSCTWIKISCSGTCGKAWHLVRQPGTWQWLLGCGMWLRNTRKSEPTTFSSRPWALSLLLPSSGDGPSPNLSSSHGVNLHRVVAHHLGALALVAWPGSWWQFTLGPSHSVTFCPWWCALLLIPTFKPGSGGMFSLQPFYSITH